MYVYMLSQHILSNSKVTAGVKYKELSPNQICVIVDGPQLSLAAKTFDNKTHYRTDRLRRWQREVEMSLRHVIHEP